MTPPQPYRRCGMIFPKTVFFAGNKDRLHRYVRRENGKLLQDQRFSVILRSNKVKGYTAIPFCFYCKYQKCDNGYNIQYFAIPTLLYLVCFLLCVVFLGLYFYHRQWNPYISCGMFVLFCIPNYFIQRSQCIRLFGAACQK